MAFICEFGLGIKVSNKSKHGAQKIANELEANRSRTSNFDW